MIQHPPFTDVVCCEEVNLHVSSASGLVNVPVRYVIQHPPFTDAVCEEVNLQVPQEGTYACACTYACDSRSCPISNLTNQGAILIKSNMHHKASTMEPLSEVTCELLTGMAVSTPTGLAAVSTSPIDLGVLAEIVVSTPTGLAATCTSPIGLGGGGYHMSCTEVS